MKRASQRDTNHADIVKVLRAYGCSVLDLSRVGGGCPDILVGYRGRNVLLEIKRAKAKGVQAGKLNTLQEAFHADWRGCLFVVRTYQEALEFVGVKSPDAPTWVLT